MKVMHIIPVDDLENHKTGRGFICKCEPKTEKIDGGYMVTHNSYDRREVFDELVPFLQRVPAGSELLELRLGKS